MRAQREQCGAPSISAFRAWKVSYLLGAREPLVYIGGNYLEIGLFSKFSSTACGITSSLLHFLLSAVFSLVFSAVLLLAFEARRPRVPRAYGASSRKQEKGFARRGPSRAIGRS